MKRLINKIAVTTRLSENPSLSCNGGDYNEGYTLFRYDDGTITFKEWSSNELLEGTFEEEPITEEKATKMLYSDGYTVSQVYNFFKALG